MHLCGPAHVILHLHFATPTTNIPQRNGDEFGETVRILPACEFDLFLPMLEGNKRKAKADCWKKNGRTFLKAVSVICFTRRKISRK